jgi:hypothetical protein
MVAPTIPEAIRALEAEIGLPPGFFAGIAREDDWSFVIKLHALIEHCVTSLIVRRTKGLGLDRVVGQLRFNDIKTGKLAVARDLQLLSPEYVDFIRAVCEIRNAFVHYVDFLAMPLSKYIEKHSSRTNLARRVCRLMAAEASLRGHTLPATTLFDQHPKVALQIAAMALLADIYLGHERVRLARDQEQLAQKQEQVVQQALLLLRDRQELDAKIQVIERFLTIDRRPEEGT